MVSRPTGYVHRIERLLPHFGDDVIEVADVVVVDLIGRGHAAEAEQPGHGFNRTFNAGIDVAVFVKMSAFEQ